MTNRPTDRLKVIKDAIDTNSPHLRKLIYAASIEHIIPIDLLTYAALEAVNPTAVNILLGYGVKADHQGDQSGSLLYKLLKRHLGDKPQDARTIADMLIAYGAGQPVAGHDDIATTAYDNEDYEIAFYLLESGFICHTTIAEISHYHAQDPHQRSLRASLGKLQAKLNGCPMIAQSQLLDLDEALSVTIENAAAGETGDKLQQMRAHLATHPNWNGHICTDDETTAPHQDAYIFNQMCALSWRLAETDTQPAIYRALAWDHYIRNGWFDRQASLAKWATAHFTGAALKPRWFPIPQAYENLPYITEKLTPTPSVECYHNSHIWLAHEYLRGRNHYLLEAILKIARGIDSDFYSSLMPEVLCAAILEQTDSTAVKILLMNGVPANIDMTGAKLSGMSERDLKGSLIYAMFALHWDSDPEFCKTTAELLISYGAKVEGTPRASLPVFDLCSLAIEDGKWSLAAYLLELGVIPWHLQAPIPTEHYKQMVRALEKHIIAAERLAQQSQLYILKADLLAPYLQTLFGDEADPDELDRLRTKLEQLRKKQALDVTTESLQGRCVERLLSNEQAIERLIDSENAWALSMVALPELYMRSQYKPTATQIISWLRQIGPSVNDPALEKALIRYFFDMTIPSCR